jgi:hypothetical protein
MARTPKKRDKVKRAKKRQPKDHKKIRRPGGSNASPLITRRRKKSSIRPGMQLGHLYISKRVNTKKGSSGGQRWLCECSCGERITVPQWYLVRKEFPKRHCGCQTKSRGNSNTRERGIFYMMHRRCYNDTHVAYKHYGGANPPITVCDSWNKDKVGNEEAWNNFFKDMGPAPTTKHTLDRIDPYQGYGWIVDAVDGKLKLNCRWATPKQQMNNLKRHWPTLEERQAKFDAEKFDVDLEEEEDDADS